VSDPLLKKIKLKSPEEIIERARDIISRHRRRFLQRNSRPCPVNCKMAEMMGRKIIGCTGCGSHDPNQCLKADQFSPLYTKEELFKQFAAQLRDPGVLLREYRDVVVFLWVMGAFEEESQVDETIVPLVEKKHVQTGVRPELSTSGTTGGHEVEERNYNVASPSDLAASRRRVSDGSSGDSGQNYNRTESPDTSSTAGQRRPWGVQGRSRSAAK